MITNRPPVLEKIPHYKELPRLPIGLDRSVLPNVLNSDLFTLDGLQPMTSDIAEISAVSFPQPSSEIINYYSRQQIKFQMILIVANLYGFKDASDISEGRPYSISLVPASKRGKVEKVSAKFFRNFSVEKILDSKPVYLDFNSFIGRWSLFGDSATLLSSSDEMYTDSIGFVIGAYFLADRYNKRDVLLTDIKSIDSRTRRKYRDYRIKRYYAPFRKLEPRKLWGADSPIELFLIHALAAAGLFPTIQTSIFRDGSIYANFYDMVSASNIKREDRLITSADLYFEKEKLAIFCDSKQHHTSDKAKSKDRKIDASLNELNIRSLRIQGPTIMHDLPGCVTQIKEWLARSSET